MKLTWFFFSSVVFIRWFPLVLFLASMWRSQSSRKITAVNFVIFYILFCTTLSLWILESCPKVQNDLYDTGPFIWKKSVFPPEFLQKLASGRWRAPYLSVAVFWFVLTMLFVTDGAPLLNRSCFADNLTDGASFQPAIFLPGTVWSDKAFCNPLSLCLFCVCTRPFPSEDTALNEDDVYRSLEELAE